MIIEVRDFPSKLNGSLSGYLKALSRAREMAREELLVKNRIAIEPMAHQLAVAKKVIYEMGTRAILADEVGLGKTIEAGLILKEKILRNEVERALILTPASLVEQWRLELDEKFGLKFKAAGRNYDFSDNFIISSIHLAKREPYREKIMEKEWDMLIVDEAHHARNPSTMNYRLIRSINSKFLLLLTATPVSNSLKELYYLADLVSPGIFGTYREFEERYFQDRKGREVKNPEGLQMKIEKIMVRNRRRDVFVDFTDRVVRTHMAEMSSQEEELYSLILEFLRSEENKLRVISYAKAATSSPRAVAKMAWNSLEREKNIRSRNYLLQIYRAAMDSEFKKLELLGKISENVESGVVFTTYLQTQKEIHEYLSSLGFSVHLFHGGMSRDEKNEIIKKFREEGGFLVATDSGGEGLNLQFANTMINFDLPWNPMRVEQRIGRIHRIGQVRDVYVINLAYRDTIEEHVLNILDKKINLFKSVVGEVDAILGSLERNFESIIADIIMRATSHEDIKHGFEELGEEMSRLRSKYEASERINDALFSQFQLNVVYGGA